MDGMGWYWREQFVLRPSHVPLLRLRSYVSFFALSVIETYPEILPFLRVASHFLSANFLPFKLVLWILILIRIDFGVLDPDPGGQKLPTKKGKRKKCFGCSLFKAEGFYCSLDVLCVGLLGYLILKNMIFSNVIFIYFWPLKVLSSEMDPAEIRLIR